MTTRCSGWFLTLRSLNSQTHQLLLFYCASQQNDAELVMPVPSAWQTSAGWQLCVVNDVQRGRTRLTPLLGIGVHAPPPTQHQEPRNKKPHWLEQAGQYVSQYRSQCDSNIVLPH